MSVGHLSNNVAVMLCGAYSTLIYLTTIILSLLQTLCSLIVCSDIM